MTNLMPQDKIDFAAHMCSRLCHDLISPVGAISNGLEILAEETDPDMQAQVIEMLHQSAQVTASKLRYYRMAFGASGGLDAVVDLRELKDIADAFIRSGKADLDWQVAGASIPKSHAKVLLIALMTAADALVRGGMLVVTGSESGGYRLHGEGPKVIVDEDVNAILSGERPASLETSRYAPLALFLSLMQASGLTHNFHQTPSELIIVISPA